jgi:hypothetical protein
MSQGGASRAASLPRQEYAPSQVLMQESGRPSRLPPPTEGEDDMARRFAIVIGVAGMMALGVALLATPASAVTEYHFKLFEKQSFQGVPANPEPGKGFRYKGKMFDPQNRDNRVGSDRGQCTIKPHGAVKCEGTTHLNGEIGGLGDIEYRGTARPNDQTFNVVGGSDDFDGATGKTGFRNLNRDGTKIMTKWDLLVP